MGIELDELAMLMEGFSGAEIEQVIISALYSTLSDDVNITHSVLEKEITSTNPLSRTYGEKIQSLRNWAKTRTISANYPTKGLKSSCSFFSWASLLHFSSGSAPHKLQGSPSLFRKGL